MIPPVRVACFRLASASETRLRDLPSLPWRLGVRRQRGITKMQLYGAQKTPDADRQISGCTRNAPANCPSSSGAMAVVASSAHMRGQELAARADARHLSFQTRL